MVISNDKTNSRLLKVGCGGCLIYLVLFFSIAAFVTWLGLPTRFAVVILVFFVLIWFFIFWRALKQKK